MEILEAVKQSMEPPDDEVASVQRKVLARFALHERPRRDAWRSALVAATAAAAVSLLAVWGLRRPSSQDLEPRLVSGPVASEHSRDFNDGTRVEWFGGAGDVRVVDERSDHVRVEVLHGTARFDVAPRVGRIFTVEASVGSRTLVTEVVGTSFEQTVSESAVRVRVRSGLVLLCLSTHECASLVAGRELSFPASGTAPFEPRDRALFDAVQWSIEHGHAGDGSMVVDRFVTTSERRADAAQRLLDIGDRLRAGRRMAEAATAYGMSARVHPEGVLAPHARLREQECLAAASESQGSRDD